MAIEFGSFSPQSFERLVQSLAAKILGPGIAVFGAGPDGAREATFDGEIPYPSTVDRWSGYIVVQAKCRETLHRNSKDADWLVERLKSDLNKFLDLKRKLRKPAYYILATNVSLSPEVRRGGKAKIEAVFASYKKRLGLLDWAVWSADELRGFLENAADIRTTYTAWITPSDVLDRLIKNQALPNLEHALPLMLARALRHERDVRLRDAGQETEKPIYLEDVFVDLPLEGPFEASQVDKVRDRQAPPNFEENINREPEMRNRDFLALRRLLKRAADKLDPESLDDKNAAASPLPNRVVLLGGPGQGKSTLSQFLVQVARARILQAHAASTLNPQTRDVIGPTLARAQAEGLPLEGPARFPLRVDLPIFADALKGFPELSVVQYIANNIVRDLSVEVDASHIRKWLSTCPSVIIFDGLDEVPPSGNRSTLVKQIDAFWDDVHLNKCDTLVVVTTRPQGYNHDLDPKYWEHWNLAPLSSHEALEFSDRLSIVRFSDPERRNELMTELRRAAGDQATKPLMTSPLQVAILFGLAVLKGTIPQSRWDLFERYYSVIRDREAQKPGHSGAMLRTYKSQLDRLHYQSGFLLQVTAEIEGNSQSFLSPSQFEGVILGILHTDGYEAAESIKIARDLLGIATQRLVLLSSRTEDQIAFDVRSLQEFMAAAQIASASTVPLSEKLRAISLNSHWRHVLRIIASKVFSAADLSMHRADVVALCDSLDSGDHRDETRIIKAGSRLALDLLNDGVVAAVPAFRRALVRRAIGLADLGTSPALDTLLLHFDPDTRAVFDQELDSRLSHGNSRIAVGAWQLLFFGLQRDADWAEEMIVKYRSIPSMDWLEILSRLAIRGVTDRISAMIKDAQYLAGPQAAMSFVTTLTREGVGYHSDEGLDALRRLSVLPAGTLDCFVRLGPHSLEASIIEGGGRNQLSTSFIPVEQSSAFCIDEVPAGSNSGWAPWMALNVFF